MLNLQLIFYTDFSNVAGTDKSSVFWPTSSLAFQFFEMTQLHEIANKSDFSGLVKTSSQLSYQHSVTINYKMHILIKVGSCNSFLNAIHKTAYYTKGALGLYGLDTSTLKLTKQSQQTPLVPQMETLWHLNPPSVFLGAQRASGSENKTNPLISRRVCVCSFQLLTERRGAAKVKTGKNTSMNN